MKKLLLALIFVLSLIVVQAIEICDDGIDNSCNGLVDCEDPYCFFHDACKPCQYDSVHIRSVCPADGCREGDTIIVEAVYSGRCPNPAYIQVDAAGDDCRIEYGNNPDIQGISVISGGIRDRSNALEWTIPSIPEKCKGQLIRATVSSMYADGFPDGFTRPVAIADEVTGAFMFAPSLCGNGVIDPGENCINCPQDAGCAFGELCCADAKCAQVCEVEGPCNYDGICQPGENCLCQDCFDEQDGCKEGLVCSDGLCACPKGQFYCPADNSCCHVECKDGMCPDTCGDGNIDPGENCLTCPEDAGCEFGQVCCADGSCQSEYMILEEGAVCEPAPCNNDGICDRGETCHCADCLGEQDGCADDLVCGMDNFCRCPPGQNFCWADNTCCEYQCVNNMCPSEEPPVCPPGEYYCSEDGSCCTVPCVSNMCPSQFEPPECPPEDPYCDIINPPEPWPGYGVYIWDVNCTYYLCAYRSDPQDNYYLTAGNLTSRGKREVPGNFFHNVRGASWESEDTITLGNANNLLRFSSYLYDMWDCVVYNHNATIRHELDLNGSRSVENIYLDYAKANPLDNPFIYANPACAHSCTAPSDCGTKYLFFGTRDCSYEECIFECGGYWVTTFVPGSEYCKDCEQNMECSDYNNMPSCNFDPCNAASTHFGCSWDSATAKCEDALNPCPPGTALCADGTCSHDCYETDWKPQGCIGEPNNICEPGEGCACPDCIGKQDSCTDGAVCGTDNLCGCPTGTTLCKDNTCHATCEGRGGKMGCIGEPNGICELGEGCACPDCNDKQDSCIEGSVCNPYLERCIEYPPASCKEGETLCNDMTCHATCEGRGGKRGCIGEPNGICELGEGCACPDCHNRRDSCELGLVCNFDYKLCEKISGGGGEYTPPINVTPPCVGDDCSQVNQTVVPVLEGIELSIESIPALRVLDRYSIKVNVRNMLDTRISDLQLEIIVPEKFTVNRAVQAVSLGPKESRTVVFDLLVRDYNRENAVFTVRARLPNTEPYSQEIPVKISIPQFLVAPEPVFDTSGSYCVNFYVVINRKDLNERLDVELNVVNPNAIFGRSVLVDYVSGINPGGNILIRPLISETNRYCLPGGREYEVRGYLYRAAPWKIVEIADQSIQKLYVER
jgi:hypothetical protein